MNLTHRICLDCRSQFIPTSNEDWWCSNECRGTFEVLATLNRKMEEEVVSANVEEEPMKSEAEKARENLKPLRENRTTIRKSRTIVGSIQDNSPERILKAVAGLSTMAQKQSEEEAVLMLYVARTFLDKAIALLEAEIPAVEPDQENPKSDVQTSWFPETTDMSGESQEKLVDAYAQLGKLELTRPDRVGRDVDFSWGDSDQE